MNTNVKLLIACAGALVLAGGGYAALMLTGDNTADSSSKSSETIESEIEVSTAFLDLEKSDIKYVSVKNSEGEYKGIPDGEPDENGNVSMTIEGLEGLEVNTTLTSSLLSSSAVMNFSSTVEENAQDLEKYGLKNPLAEVTVKGSSTEKTLIVGNESPISGKTYCMEKGRNTVYLTETSNVSVYFNSITDYVSKTMLEQPSEEETPKIEKLTVNRTDLKSDIVLEYDKSGDSEETKSGTMATHYMTSPIFAYLDSEKSQTAVSGFFGLSADSVVTIHPTKDEKAASGFDKPFCTVTMKTDKPEEHILKLGNRLQTGDNSGYYLAMIDDTDIIYAVDPDSVCWAEMEPADIMSKMVFGTYVWDIGSLDITVNGGEKVSFKGSGSNADDYKVTKNGGECDKERFRTFYTFLLKTAAEEYVEDAKTEGEPLVSVEVETQDGSTKQTVEFYKADGKKALISVNGNPYFKCRMAYVDLLIDNLGKFDTNEEFVMNW